jgi:hypothetical protein
VMRPQCSHVSSASVLICIKIDSGHFGYLLKLILKASGDYDRIIAEELAALRNP